MISDEEWDVRQRQAAERRERIAANIKLDIDSRGVEYVLADIILGDGRPFHYDREIKKAT